MNNQGIIQKNIAQLSSNVQLTDLTGFDQQKLVEYFKDRASKLNMTEKYQIRQKIFNFQIMKQTKYMSIDLQVRHSHLNFCFQDQLEAALLSTCSIYHPWHIRYIASQITSKGQLYCPQCKTICQRLGDIIPDALMMSVYHKTKCYPGSILIFTRKQVSSEIKTLFQSQGEKDENKTIVQLQNQQDKKTVFIETKVLQCVRDEKLSQINFQTLFSKIEQSKNNHSPQLLQQLRENSTPILINLVCFQSYVRIRNPLIHKLCLPSEHNNRLVTFSYQHIYHRLFQSETKQEKINCPFPNCSNHFDCNNFQKVALVLPDLQKGIYEEDCFNLLGLLFLGQYTSNWHSQHNQKQIKEEQNKRLMRQINKRTNQLVSTGSLKQGMKRVAKLQKKIVKQRQMPYVREKQSTLYGQNVMIVTVGDNNICPVRCYKCPTLDSIDCFQCCYAYQKQAEKICPLCQYELKKKKFYEYYYLDVTLMQFLFFFGTAKQIFYDIEENKYFHQIEHYTGSSLKQFLKQIGQQYQGRIVTEGFKIALDRTKRYIVVIDKRCIQKIGQTSLANHLIFLVENQTISNKAVCPTCQIAARSDKLMHVQEIQMLLLLNNNDLRYLQGKLTNFNSQQAISSLRFYSDIKRQFKKSVTSKNQFFYWRNYQGEIIRYPFIFSRCEHPFETAICDFADINYQVKFQGIIKFKCRYTECDKEYEDAFDMERVTLGIEEQIETLGLKREIIKTNNFWIKLDTQHQVSLLGKNSEIMAEQSKYRNKNDKKIEQTANKRELLTLIKNTKEKIYQLQQLELKQQARVSLRDYEKQLELLIKQQKKLQQDQRSKNIPNFNSASINFGRLNRQFPSQFKKMQEKAQNIGKIQQELVSFQNIETQGNLLLFKYPLPQHPFNQELMDSFKKKLEETKMLQSNK